MIVPDSDAVRPRRPILIEITTPDARYASRGSDTAPSSSDSRSPAGSPRWVTPTRCERPPSSIESIMRREPIPPVPCRAPLRLSPARPTSFSRETARSTLSNRQRLAGRQDGVASLEPFAAPAWFESRGRGRVSPILLPNPLMILPLTRVRGDFTGELSGASTASLWSPVA